MVKTNEMILFQSMFYENGDEVARVVAPFPLTSYNEGEMVQINGVVYLISLRHNEINGPTEDGPAEVITNYVVTRWASEEVEEFDESSVALATVEESFEAFMWDQTEHAESIQEVRVIPALYHALRIKTGHFKSKGYPASIMDTVVFRYDHTDVPLVEDNGLTTTWRIIYKEESKIE